VLCEAYGLVKKCGCSKSKSNPEKLRLWLFPKPGDELLEPLDSAASTNARVDGVPARADPLVLRLQVEAPVKIEGGAILVELGADPARPSEDEVDLLRPGQECSSYCACPDALGALALFPFELGHQGARLNGYAKDDFVLHYEASDRLPDHARLSCEQPEKQGHELEDRPRDHLPPAAITAGFAAER
jgi:hypothetical protein